MIGLTVVAVVYGLVFCGLWAAEKGLQPVNEGTPRIGGVIEDETGWWQIMEVAEEEGGVWLMDKRGTEQFRMFSNLGHVSYDQ